MQRDDDCFILLERSLHSTAAILSQVMPPQRQAYYCYPERCSTMYFPSTAYVFFPFSIILLIGNRSSAETLYSMSLQNTLVNVQNILVSKSTFFASDLIADS